MEFKSLSDTPVNLILKKSPNGWIQFKGTDLCMDVHCSCGEMTHIDGDFVYFIKCSACGKIYELNGHIELIERRHEEFSAEEADRIKETSGD